MDTSNLHIEEAAPSTPWEARSILQLAPTSFLVFLFYLPRFLLPLVGRSGLHAPFSFFSFLSCGLFPALLFVFFLSFSLETR